MQSGEGIGDPRDVRGLVPLAAMRRRCEKRAVGFDQRPIEWHEAQKGIVLWIM